MTITVTKEDIMCVLESHQSDVDINDVMSIIDDDEIARKCEDNEDMYNIIAKQLYKNGYLTRKQIKKYGNVEILNY